MKYIGWVQLLLGLRVLVSPWILGFTGITTALWSNIVAGILMVILALWALFGIKSQSPPLP